MTAPAAHNLLAFLAGLACCVLAAMGWAMITIDIADKLRRAHTDDGRKWRDLTANEKRRWLDAAEVVERMLEDATAPADNDDYD